MNEKVELDQIWEKIKVNGYFQLAMKIVQKESEKKNGKV